MQTIMNPCRYNMKFTNVKRHKYTPTLQRQPKTTVKSLDFLTTASIWVPTFCKAGTAFIMFYSFQQWLMYRNINQEIEAKRKKEDDDQKKKK